MNDIWNIQLSMLVNNTFFMKYFTNIGPASFDMGHQIEWMNQKWGFSDGQTNWTFVTKE